MIYVYTVISCNYLAEARVLMKSVAKHWPEAKRTVFVTDSPKGKFDPQKEEFEVVEAIRTDLPRYRQMAFAFSAGEFCFVLKSYCARHLLARKEAEALVYFDSDMLLLNEPKELQKMIQEHSVILTPHRLQAEPGKTLHLSQLQGGAFNAGFFAIRAGEEGEGFLRWWGNQVREPANMRADWFFDQGWLNLCPAYFAGLGILRHPGYNVAFWNLKERNFHQDDEKGWRCGKVSLVLFHFSLFDPHHPDELTGGIDYAGIGLNPVLDALLTDYKKQLNEAGWNECHRWSYDHGQFQDGKKITYGHRRYFQKRFFHDLPKKTDPFDPKMKPRGLKSLYYYDNLATRFIRKLKGTEN